MKLILHLYDFIIIIIYFVFILIKLKYILNKIFICIKYYYYILKNVS